ncbi:hypothetical protein ACQKP5_01635 [Pseudomonas vancouverensis]|uniref:hypothetical protein n=1 Tax=Pseudomonas vancouverensis TaxID=95300 RepID=UPI003D003272
MASDGRKNSLPAWSQREPGRADADPFPEPDVSEVTLPGLPPGLFPRASLDTDITLKIPAWPTIPSDPSDKEAITVELARVGTSNYEEVDKVEYVPGTTPLPVVVKIPSTWLLKDENEGAFNLRYFHENYLGTPSPSDPVLVFIDKIPPNGTAAPDKLTYTFTPPIVDATLTGVTDLEFTVPAWTGAAEGDKVAFTVVAGKLPDDPNDIVPIDIVELGADRKIKFPVAGLKNLPDGDYCFGYVVVDKAGNRSRISNYDLIPLALGTFPPNPYPPLNVPEADDGVVDRADALQGVYAEFLKILHAKATDSIEIIWGTEALPYRTPVGANPPNKMSINVIWEHMRDQYGAATGPVLTDVEYKLYRGSVALGGAATKVNVDFSHSGPVNPDPGPGNPSLDPLEVFGESDVANKLIASDENKPVVARIKLYDPLTEDDTIQVFWDGEPIGSPYNIDPDAENPGDEIDIDLDWAIIRKHGNNTKMPVTYVLTNPAFGNPQEPKIIAEVDITFLTIDLPEAEPQDLFNNRLTCRSLHFEGGKIGFRYLIPPSDYLKAGMTVGLEWRASHTYASPVEVPAAGKKATYGPISDTEAKNGFLWFIEPYATHILPTWASATNQIGKGEVRYTLDVGGVAQPSPFSDTQVGLTQGAGTCDLTPPTA